MHAKLISGFFYTGRWDATLDTEADLFAHLQK